MARCSGAGMITDVGTSDRNCFLRFNFTRYNIKYYTASTENLQKVYYLLVSIAVPNQPGKGTASASFTLPKELVVAIERKARSELTNKSDIIRRALMNYLTAGEREEVLREMGIDKYEDINTWNLSLNDKAPTSSSDEDIADAVAAIPSAERAAREGRKIPILTRKPKAGVPNAGKGDPSHVS